MCTVEVALLADVLRIRGGNSRSRCASDVPPRSICRRLFTEESGESSTACLNRLESELQRQARQRWNFDFRTETPLLGRYQWVPVGVTSRHQVPTKVSGELPQTTASTKVNSSPLVTLPQTAKTRSPTTSTQSKITDFLHQRKRHRTQESDLPCPKPLKARRTTGPNSPSVVTID